MRDERWKAAGLAYAAMVAAAVAAFLVIRSYGERLTAPSPLTAGPGTAPAAAQPDAILHVLLALAAVLITGRLLGRVLAALRQPPVIGEVLAGILLGPSLLGR